jgi:primosomal replication protein N
VDCNRLELSGEIVAFDALRHTPAGIPLQTLVIRHVSTQSEAGMKRQVECEISAVAMADVVRQTGGLKIGDRIRVVGFLTRKSLKSDRLVLHLHRIETEQN